MYAVTHGGSKLQQAAWLLLAALLCGGPGCSVKRMALRETAAVLRQGVVALNQEGDYQLAREGMPANLKTVEVMLASDPESPDLLFLLAQGYAAYTYLVLEDDLDLADAAGEMERVRLLKQRASALYARAQGYALRIFGSAELERMLQSGELEQVLAALADLRVEDAPALFWYSFAWTGRINLDQSNPARIADLRRVEILLERTVQLDARYYHGLPLLTSGALYAGRATMFGGDLERGRRLLEDGVKASDGRFLLGKFLLARFYAVQVQDKKLFCALLADVAAADQGLLPEQQLMNNVSQRWAVRWRERASLLFEGGEGGCVEPAPAAEEKVEEDNGLLLE